MTFSVKMPALGESVTEGTVTRWLKSEGDQVALDEPLLEVSTDKVDTEIPSPAAGVLQKIVVGVDQIAAVGSELALIADGASASSAPQKVESAPAQKQPEPVVAQTPKMEPVIAAAAPVSNNDSTIVYMPALGESVSEGTVTRWLKSVGDSVSADEALLEVSTDKVDTEIPSPVTGTILSIDVNVDSTVPVGARLASIGSAGAAPAAKPAPVVQAPVVQASVVQEQVVPPVIPTPTPAAPVTPAVMPAAKSSLLSDAYVTPIVRKLANENGVDLSRVSGTGVGGRIRKEDVLAAIGKPVTAPPSQTIQSAPISPIQVKQAVTASPLRGTTVTMSRLRKVIAARMLESLQVSAQLTTVVEVDITKIARLREKS